MLCANCGMGCCKRWAMLRSLSLLVALFIFTFGLVELAPGDYLSTLDASATLSPDTQARLRVRLGLDDPLPARALGWLASLARGECGISVQYEAPVCSLVAPRLLATLQLNLVATALAWLLALLLVLAPVLRPSGWADRGLRVAAATLLGLPELLLALLGLWALGYHPLLPYAVLMLGTLPVLWIHLRYSLGEALQHPSVRAAHALGITGWPLWRHYVAPLTAAPLLPLAGLSFGRILSASLLVEAALGVPGLGPLVLEALAARDAAVLAITVGAAGLMLMGALQLAQWGQRRFDPRLAEPQR